MGKKNNTNEMIKAYAIFSQGIATMIILGVIGFIIGWNIDKHSALCGILAVFGAIIGLIYFIFLVYRNHYFDSPTPKKGDDNKDEK